MKTFMASSVAAVMLFGAGQAHAADFVDPSLPSLSAVMSIYAGAGIVDSDDVDFESDDPHLIIGGDARVAGESWMLEIAGAGHTSAYDRDQYGGEYSDEEGTTYFAAAGHWLSRSPGNTWGLFAGFSNTTMYETDENVNHFFGGIEFAAFGDQTTWFAQGGGVICVYGECSDTWESGGFGRVGFRYFPTDVQKFEIDFMGGVGNFDGDEADETGFTAAWGAEYEHQLNGPFSVFLAYRGHYVEDSEANEESPDGLGHAGLIGFRVDVGSETLRQRDVSGAGTFSMPDFFRAFSWPDEL